MSDDFPQVWFGNIAAPTSDWRDRPDPTPDDDAELDPTPAYIVDMLGFDPQHSDDAMHKSRLNSRPIHNVYNVTDEKIGEIAHKVQVALDNLRDHVIKTVEEYLGKADPSPSAQASAITSRLEVQDELHAIVHIEPNLAAIGGAAAKDALKATAETAKQRTPFNATFHTVDQRMARYAKERSAELIGKHVNADGSLSEARDAELRIDETTRAMLNDSLSAAITAGLTASQIRSGLMQDYAFSPARALTIARTEAAFAHSRGAMVGYREAAKEFNLTLVKRWIADDQACDECLANAEQEPIPLDDLFESGDDAAPAHPNCRCDIVTEVVDPDGNETEVDDGDDTSDE